MHNAIHYLSPCRFHFPASTNTRLPSTHTESWKQISPSWGVKQLMAFPRSRAVSGQQLLPAEGSPQSTGRPRGAAPGECPSDLLRDPAPHVAVTASGPTSSHPIYGRARSTSTSHIRAPARRPKMVPQLPPSRCPAAGAAARAIGCSQRTPPCRCPGPRRGRRDSPAWAQRGRPQAASRTEGRPRPRPRPRATGSFSSD